MSEKPVSVRVALKRLLDAAGEGGSRAEYRAIDLLPRNIVEDARAALSSPDDTPSMRTAMERLITSAKLLSAEHPDPGTEALAAIYCAEQALSSPDDTASSRNAQAVYDDLVAFFNTPEGFREFGNNGDHMCWSPSRTAIEAMKELIKARASPDDTAERLAALERDLEEADDVIALYNAAWKAAIGTKEQETWEGKAFARRHSRVAKAAPPKEGT